MVFQLEEVVPRPRPGGGGKAGGGKGGFREYIGGVGEGGGEETYDLQVDKVAGDVAISQKLRDGRFPRRRVRVTGFEVWWGGAAREEPHEDVATGPFGDEDAASVGVEVGTVRERALILNVAARVGRLAGRVDVAVWRRHRAGEVVLVSDGAVVRGVQGHGIVGVVIDAFDNVDFARGRPSRTEHPVCGPVSGAK